MLKATCQPKKSDNLTEDKQLNNCSSQKKGLSSWFPLQLQTSSETVFGVVFWSLNTYSRGIWSILEH